MEVKLTHKVVISAPLTMHHEVSEEAIREQHLHSLVVARQVAFKVVPAVRVASAPPGVKGD